MDIFLGFDFVRFPWIYPTLLHNVCSVSVHAPVNEALLIFVAYLSTERCGLV